MSGIILRNAWFGYGDDPIIKGVDLRVPRGMTAVITGPNGSGKSTLLHLSAGLLPVSGEVARTRRNVRRRPTPERSVPAPEYVAVSCSKKADLLSNMNALANVALSLRYHADVLQLTIDDVEKRAKKALQRVRIHEDDFYSLPAHLSFGTRKRLALARAIALRPTFFFFDDPDVRAGSTNRGRGARNLVPIPR